MRPSLSVFRPVAQRTSKLRQSFAVLVLFVACGDDEDGSGGGITGATSAATSSSTGMAPVIDDPCFVYATGSDCRFAPIDLGCTWYTNRIAPGCASMETVVDLGCYSEASNCAGGLSCDPGLTCTQVLSVGEGCWGQASDGSITCADQCAESTHSLCLPPSGS